MINERTIKEDNSPWISIRTVTFQQLDILKRPNDGALHKFNGEAAF